MLRAPICMLLFLLLSGVSMAQTPLNADLGVTAQLDPPGPVSPGGRATLVLTFSNAGPEAAPRVAATLSPYSSSLLSLDLPMSGAPGPCSYVVDVLSGGPGGPNYVVFTSIAGPIAPGGQVVCSYDLRVGSNAAGVHDIELEVGDLLQPLADPNLANNQASLRVLFAQQPTTIPSESTWSFLLAVVVLASFAWRRLASRG